MILVIDTSSPAESVVVTIDGEALEEFRTRGFDRELIKRLVAERTPGRVAVASGPGSFTGLRVGVSFGLGLAMGLRIPIVPLPTLALQAARSRVAPVTAVVDAGRGRYYFQPPDAPAKLGEPVDIPTQHPLVGRVVHRESLLAAGLHFKPEEELVSFALAAKHVLEKAREVPYGRLEIEYMQTFSIPTKSEPSA